MISSNEEAIKSIEEEFALNPVWSGVKAVQEGRVIHLPQEYFCIMQGLIIMKP